MIAPSANVSRQPDEPQEKARGGPLDREHLTRMTLGDLALEREVLALFDRQSELLLERIRAGRVDAGAAAHTLKGSALGIGAFAVARAAAAVEGAGASGRARPVEQLAAAIAEARAAIAAILAAEAPSIQPSAAGPSSAA